MAMLTPLTLDEARALGARYGLDVVAARPLLAGSVNTNVELGLAGGGRAFLRVYEEQTAATAAGEARLLRLLAAHGVPTPRPLALADDPAARLEFIASHAGKPVAVFPWVEGESVCQARVTPEAAAQVGEALARVHLATIGYADAPPSRFGPAELAARLRSLDAARLPPELAADVARLEERLSAFARRRPPVSGLAHGDLFRDNVLWRGGRIAALLDFESASRETPAFDLMVTILAWCYGDALDPVLSRALAEGYSRVRPLSETEADSLCDEGRFAALRFAITRITDFELRPRGLGQYRDYRRFLARWAAVDRLGPAGVRALLGV